MPDWKWKVQYRKLVKVFFFLSNLQWDPWQMIQLSYQMSEQKRSWVHTKHLQKNKTERVRSGPGRGEKHFVLYEYITNLLLYVTHTYTHNDSSQPCHFITLESFRHTRVISSQPCYFVTAMSFRHSRVISSHSSFFVTPESFRHTWVISSHPSHFVTPESFRHTQVISSHPIHFVTPESFRHTRVMSSPPCHVVTPESFHVMLKMSCRAGLIFTWWAMCARASMWPLKMVKKSLGIARDDSLHRHDY